MRPYGVAMVAIIAFLLGLPTGYYYGAASAIQAQNGVSVIAASLYAPYLSSVLNATGERGSVTAMGSVAAARQVILAPRQYAIFLSVDPAVIDDILVPAGQASWYIAVAGDQMVIGVSRLSPAFGEIKELNQSLYAAILSENVTAEKIYLAKILTLILSGNYAVGTSNPNTDPEGYRALMMLELAGLWIYGNSSIYLSRLSQLNSSGMLYEVPQGSALFSYLDVGKASFDIALYLSSARAEGIPYVVLPYQVNLGSGNFSSFYSQASVTIFVQGKEVTLHGAPIYICFTIPNGYRNKALAASIAVYMISPGGLEALKRYGAEPLSRPMLYGNESAVPYPLSALINTSVLGYGGPID